MSVDEEALRLLREIRDLQREHLEEYRKVAADALETQRLSVQRQLHATQFSRRVVIGLLAAAAPLFLLLVYLLTRWGNRLF